METQENSGLRGSMMQCLIALAVIALAFRIADVSPSAALTTAPAAPPEPAWTAHLAALDEALARRDVGAAVGHWEAGRAAARAAGRWDGLVALGDASRRLAEATGSRLRGEAGARTLYLEALFRARQHQAVDGVLRVATAFAGLGDHEVVAQCLRVGAELTARSGDRDAAARVLVLGRQLAGK